MVAAGCMDDWEAGVPRIPLTCTGKVLNMGVYLMTRSNLNKLQ